MLAPSVRSSLLVSAFALAAFAVVAWAVNSIPAVPALDEAVALRLNQEAKASSASVGFFRRVTSLGTTPFLTWLSIAVIALLLIRGHWQLASAWVIILMLVALFTQHTKLAFGRQRPTFNGEFAREDSLSFPSGHAFVSLVVFGMLAYLIALATGNRRIRRVTYATSICCIMMIGFSRLFLGVHYLSDVIGGYFLGAAWLAFCIALIEDARRHYSSASNSAGQ